MSRPSAAEFAACVDRAVIAIHHAVRRRHGDILRPMLAGLDLTSPGHVVDLAEFFSADACTLEVAHLRFRYDPPEAVDLTFDELRDRDLVDVDLRTTPRLDIVVRSLLEARAETVAVAWGDQPTGLLDVGAGRALSRSRGPLVEHVRCLPEPSENASRLFHRLNALRYARMDAHGDAWRTAGLAAAEIVALSAAVEGDPVRPPPARLVDLGWVSAQGDVTGAGRAARACIEADTNARCQVLVDAIAEPARWIVALNELPPE